MQGLGYDSDLDLGGWNTGKGDIMVYCVIPLGAPLDGEETGNEIKEGGKSGL